MCAWAGGGVSIWRNLLFWLIDYFVINNGRSLPSLLTTGSGLYLMNKIINYILIWSKINHKWIENYFGESRKQKCFARFFLSRLYVFSVVLFHISHFYLFCSLCCRFSQIYDERAQKTKNLLFTFCAKKFFSHWNGLFAQRFITQFLLCCICNTNLSMRWWISFILHLLLIESVEDWLLNTPEKRSVSFDEY